MTKQDRKEQRPIVVQKYPYFDNDGEIKWGFNTNIHNGNRSYKLHAIDGVEVWSDYDDLAVEIIDSVTKQFLAMHVLYPFLKNL